MSLRLDRATVNPWVSTWKCRLSLAARECNRLVAEGECHALSDLERVHNIGRMRTKLAGLVRRHGKLTAKRHKELTPGIGGTADNELQKLG